MSYVAFVWAHSGFGMGEFCSGVFVWSFSVRLFGQIFVPSEMEELRNRFRSFQKKGGMSAHPRISLSLAMSFLVRRF